MNEVFWSLLEGETALIGSQIARRLLWVDDDGARRFRYEERLLRNRGWLIRWAESVEEALRELQENVFDAVLLDNMLPLKSGRENSSDIWNGCLLLCWLHGLPAPSAVPPVDADSANLFLAFTPHEGNRSTKVIVISGFFDPKIEAAMAAAKQQIVPILPKPLEIEQLLEIIERQFAE